MSKEEVQVTQIRPNEPAGMSGYLFIMLLLGIGLIFQAGCGSGYKQSTAKVRGTVTLDGKPLSAGTVIFVPLRGRGASAPLAADGTFTLKTYDTADGAIVGRHKVAVIPLQPEGGGNTLPPGHIPVPAQYQSSESSGLEYEIKADQENVFEIKLKN